MSELTQIDLPPDRWGVHLRLHHYAALDDKQARKPVLLLHGASANHRTFITPDGSNNLAAWLAERNFDPWLLDWRGSGLVVDEPDNQESLQNHGRAYNFNAAAKCDIRAAIRAIRQHHQTSKIAALGFCMGGGVLAEAVALGHVTGDDLDCIVLMTLGLFYEVPIDGRLKSEDRVLERLESTTRQTFVSIDPRMGKKLDLRAPWPADLNDMYTEWPAALKSHEEEPGEPVMCMCNRVSFMYGMPYHHHNLVAEIHGSAKVAAALPQLFGAIPLHMYIHGARNIRAGQATFYKNGRRGNELIVSVQARGRFSRLEKVTLITGALNRLWHRDSIDRMYEWLTRGRSDDLGKFQKHVLPNYGHQDLLWGRSSREDVFPAILNGLSAESRRRDHVDVDASASLQRRASHGMPSRVAAASPRA